MYTTLMHVQHGLSLWALSPRFEYLLRNVAENVKRDSGSGFPIFAALDGYGEFMLAFIFDLQAGQLEIHFMKHGACRCDLLEPQGDGFPLGWNHVQGDGEGLFPGIFKVP